MKLYLDALETVLDTFQWAYPGGDENRGEVTLDRDAEQLVLSVYVYDNEGNDELLPLQGRCRIDYDRTPQENVRQLIHAFVTHEADEQMWFDNECIFDPHQVTG